jgi:hypothetical protein
MNLAVRYKNGVQLSYSLSAYSPWEGYRIAFNGTILTGIAANQSFATGQPVQIDQLLKI